MSGVPFSAVVVTYDSRADLPGLLDGVTGDVEWVFVDNGSTDGTAQELRSRGLDPIVLPGNPGFGAACNAGVQAATRDVVVLLNPDTSAHRGLEDLAAAALASRVLLGPRLLNPDGTLQPSANARPAGVAAAISVLWPGALMPRALQAHCEPWRLTQRTTVGWLTGACVAARRDLLLELGPFDERLHLYGEDMDLGLRAAAAGVASVFDPQVASLVHAAGLSRATPASLRARADSRRWVIEQRLGRGHARYDTLTVRAALRTRIVLKTLLRRDAAKERNLLAATL